MAMLLPGPLAARLVRRRRKDYDDRLGDEDVDDRTRDGSVDLHGRPASKRRTGGWKAGWLVVVELLLSNIAFAGIANNLYIYLTNVLHESNSDASKNVSNWYGTGYVIPLISAYIADSYTGRFFGTLIWGLFAILGMTMVTVAGAVHYFRPPQCESEDVSCQHASFSQAGFFYAGLYVVNVGCGGLLGTAIAFGADQFDEEDEVEKRRKSSFFNWNYQTVLGASFVGFTLFVYIENNVSNGLGFGISVGVQLMAMAVLLVGIRIYRYQFPVGNPLPRMAQVVVAAFRKRRLKAVEGDDLYQVLDPNVENQGHNRTIQHSNKFLFLDKAAIVTQKDKDKGLESNAWRLCTVNQVEEVKYFLRIAPIFIFTIMYTACYSQLVTLFIQQGDTMDRQLGSYRIPAPSIGVFECFSVFFWVIVWDRLIVPFLRKRTGHQRGISDLKRVGIGLVLSMVAMTCAALVEIWRLHVARDHGLEDDAVTPVPLSVFWEVPQYFIMGASEVCTYVGLMEFFYDQAPDSIRSLGASISQLNIALGYFLSTLLVTIVGRITARNGAPGWIADNLNQGRVDLFYWLLVVMSAVNFLAFLVVAQMYEYKVFARPSQEVKDSPKQSEHSRDHLSPSSPTGNPLLPSRDRP